MQRNVCCAAMAALLCASIDARSIDMSQHSDAVAVIGDAVITAGDLEKLAANRLLRTRTEEYKLKREILDRRVAEILFEREAAARGMSVEQLKRVEIEAKVRPVTLEEQRAIYDSSRDRFGVLSEPQALERIATTMQHKRVEQRRQEFARELQRKERVKINLDPPRIAVDSANRPVRGPQTARVTIVLFSDFQCPYCATLLPTMERLQSQYPQKIRLVFRHFPLPMHKEAEKAAEAAQCAEEQGKFWEMHDKLFANQQSLSGEALKRYAADIGLNIDRFSRCLDSGKTAALWQIDRETAVDYGLTGTPALFINGRLVSGAVPYEALNSIVQEELERAPATATASARVEATAHD